MCNENCHGRQLFPPDEVEAARQRVAIKRVLRQRGMPLTQGILQDTNALKKLLDFVKRD